jgi:hypothetical protein
MPLTVPSEVIPFYNVLKYGVTGRSGAIDDTVAIAALFAKIEAAGGGIAYFPGAYPQGAIYRINALIDVPDGVSIWGGGSGSNSWATAFWCSGGFPNAGLRFHGAHKVHMGFTIHGNNSANKPFQSTETQTGSRTFANINVNSALQDGITCYSPQNDVFINVQSSGCARHGWVLDAGMAGALFMRCESISNGGHNLITSMDVDNGFGFAAPVQMTFDQCLFEGAYSPTLPCIYIKAGSNYTFRQCVMTHFADNIATFTIGEAAGIGQIVIDSCDIYGNGGVGTAAIKIGQAASQINIRGTCRFGDVAAVFDAPGFANALIEGSHITTAIGGLYSASSGADVSERVSEATGRSGISSVGQTVGIRSGGSIWLKEPTTAYIQFAEMPSDVAAGAVDTGRLFSRDNGAGKTQLCVRFASGAVQVIATEP